VDVLEIQVLFLELDMSAMVSVVASHALQMLAKQFGANSFGNVTMRALVLCVVQ
jgi:hypothetical protein